MGVTGWVAVKDLKGPAARGGGSPSEAEEGGGWCSRAAPGV